MHVNSKNFLEIANKIFDNMYDYSLTEYKNCNISVKITCPIHGIFLKSPGNHIYKKQGCQKCTNELKYKKYLQFFIKNCKEKHGDTYDYSLVNYKKSHDYIKIICPLHGIFEQKAYQHLKHNCPKCSDTVKNNENTIKEFKLLHGDIYDYSKVEYKNNYTKIEIICNTHGSFFQRPFSHKHGNGCPICKLSKGEIKIRNWLNDNNIEFIRQKTFPDCKGKRWDLKFDFYLPKYNICIEYDGEQHFIASKCFGGEKRLKQIKIVDEIKNLYCLKNNISFLRIKDTEYSSIETILKHTLNP